MNLYDVNTLYPYKIKLRTRVSWFIARYAELAKYYAITVRDFLAVNWERATVLYLAALCILLELAIITAALNWHAAFTFLAMAIILTCCAGIILALYALERVNR
jgi:hypothetical protein